MAFRSAFLFVALKLCAATVLSGVASANEVLQAARSGDAEALAAALPKDAPVDPGTLERPLFFAAQSGHTDVVALLLERGADPNTVLDFGSPLQKAARNNRVDVVDLLLRSGADANLIAGDLDQTALHEAAERGAMDTAKLLVQRGADVNARDRWGVPPIHLAARKGRAEMLVFLAENGASPLQALPISSEELAAADMELGRVTAIGCNQCHEVEPGVKPSSSHTHGPSLIGIVGRAMASEEGYPYSEAMKSMTGKWTLEELNRFLTDPPGVLPGTSMALLLGLSRDEHVALIAYLSEL